MRSVICDRRGPVPQEEDAPVVAEDDSNIPNLFSSDVMAFAGDTQKPVRTVLGPRTAVQPERVWIGLNPPSEAELAAQAAAEEAAEQARQQKKKAATAKKKSPKQAAAKEPDETPVIEEGSKAKSKGRVSVTVKPVTDKAKTDAQKPAAKKDQKAETGSKAKSATN
jgi:D-alanyl-D-alanine carboxypeptidase